MNKCIFFFAFASMLVSCKNETTSTIPSSSQGTIDSGVQKKDSQPPVKVNLPPELQETPDRKYTSEIIKNPDNTFGYTVRIGGKKLIEQPMIPARQGTRGFATPDEAQKVADFVIGKIRKGIVPPAVTEEELDSLGIR